MLDSVYGGVEPVGMPRRTTDAIRGSVQHVIDSVARRMTLREVLDRQPTVVKAILGQQYGGRSTHCDHTHLVRGEGSGNVDIDRREII